jgi:F-type H+-transporting ATPase subunit epsilon
MRLAVMTPERTLVDEEITEVYAPGVVGELGVLPDHTTFLGALDSGEIRYRTTRGAGVIVMSAGVVEVVDNRVTILADDAVPSSEIDLEAARKDLAAAETVLGTADPLTPTYDAASRARRWAEARVATARRGR